MRVREERNEAPEIMRGRTDMPSEKFSKCGSLICNEKFLPFLLIKSSVNCTLHPLKTVNWPLLLVSDLTWSLLSHRSFSCQIM